MQEKTIRFVLRGHQVPRRRVEQFIIEEANRRRWQIDREGDGSMLITGRYLALERFAAQLVNQINPVTGYLEHREAA